MKLYLGLLASSRPDQTRIFVEVDDNLVDLNLAYAAYSNQTEGHRAAAYLRRPAPIPAASPGSRFAFGKLMGISSLHPSYPHRENST